MTMWRMWFVRCEFLPPFWDFASLLLAAKSLSSCQLTSNPLCGKQERLLNSLVFYLDFAYMLVGKGLSLMKFLMLEKV